VAMARKLQGNGFTDKPMKGYVFVSHEGIKTKKQFDYWINLCLEFNKKAKLQKIRIMTKYNKKVDELIAKKKSAFSRDPKSSGNYHERK
jgi:hypothetical protein